MKKIIIILSIAVAILIGILIFYKPKNNKIDNKSITVNNIEFSNPELKYENEVSNFSVVATNNSTEDIPLEIIDIIFKDKKGNEIITLKGLVERTLKSGQSTTINASVPMELKNYKTIEYKF